MKNGRDTGREKRDWIMKQMGEKSFSVAYIIASNTPMCNLAYDKPFTYLNHVYKSLVPFQGVGKSLASFNLTSVFVGLIYFCFVFSSPVFVQL